MYENVTKSDQKRSETFRVYSQNLLLNMYITTSSEILPINLRVKLITCIIIFEIDFARRPFLAGTRTSLTPQSHPASRQLVIVRSPQCSPVNGPLRRCVSKKSRGQVRSSVEHEHDTRKSELGAAASSAGLPPCTARPPDLFAPSVLLSALST